MEKKKVILISGMSGAGKTSATNILEDMGYHCIDQYPVQLLDLLVDLIASSNDIKFNHIALSTNILDFMDFVRVFKNSNFDLKILYLDASNEELLHRYKNTRRAHPLLLSNNANTLEDAIEMERELFNKNKEASFIKIDTSFLSFKELKNKIEKYFNVLSISPFSISFISFGYKHGVPLDADLMFDVRFLPNPYWELELRPYSGDDEAVYNYVIDKEETQTYLKKLTSFLNYSFKQYEKEGKSHFTVGIGCTGGQHRSVAICNYLFDYYKDKYKCYKDHRDKVGIDNE